MLEIIIWIIFGAIAGWVGSLIMRSSNDNEIIVKDIWIGIFGAVISGYITRNIGDPGIEALNISSILLSIIGAVFLIAVVKIIRNKNVI